MRENRWLARFLATALLATGVRTGPLSAADTKGGLRMGQGRHTYEWVSGWLKLPPGMNVGQTHGDEEGGLRVLLRARSLPRPEGVTLWVIRTMNPDGLVLDTRFLADGADPNRRAPSEREQQAIQDFALAVRPVLTVWYHQNSGDCAVGFMWCPIDDALGSSSILVELPDVLTPADVQVHARALLAIAAGGT